jgi:phosphoesterase RecJ-like protein
MMKKTKWACDAKTAVLLMTGIITDTGNFTFTKDGRVLRVAAELVDMGVDIQKIITGIADKARKTVVVESAAAANAEFLFKNSLALAVITAKDYKNLDGRGETVLSLLGQIRGVDYVVLLKEQKAKQIGVSLRGKFKAVDKIANELGGGGHKYAAGAVVYDTLENVKKQIIDIFKKVI